MSLYCSRSEVPLQGVVSGPSIPCGDTPESNTQPYLVAPIQEVSVGGFEGPGGNWVVMASEVWVSQSRKHLNFWREGTLCSRKVVPPPLVGLADKDRWRQQCSQCLSLWGIIRCFPPIIIHVAHNMYNYKSRAESNQRLMKFELVVTAP